MAVYLFLNLATEKKSGIYYLFNHTIPKTNNNWKNFSFEIVTKIDPGHTKTLSEIGMRSITFSNVLRLHCIRLEDIQKVPFFFLNY